MKKSKPKKITMERVMNDPRYRGYHIVVIAGKVFKARTGEGASKIFDEVRKKYPKETPSYTYLPDVDSLIFGKLATNNSCGFSRKKRDSSPDGQTSLSGNF